MVPLDRPSRRTNACRNVPAVSPSRQIFRRARTRHRVGELLPILGQLEPCRLVVVSRGFERFQAIFLCLPAVFVSSPESVAVEDKGDVSFESPAVISLTAGLVFAEVTRTPNASRDFRARSSQEASPTRAARGAHCR